jgi:hypothetical protein
MNNKIENKVNLWIIEKIKNGIKIFNIEECTKDIGLNPNNKYDVEMVDEIFECFKETANMLYTPFNEYNC